MTVTASAEITKAKTAIANVESAIVTDVKTIIANPRFTSSRLWFAVGALIALILLHRAGIDATILAYIFQITILFLVLRTLTDIARDAFNTMIECCRVKYGFNDGAPAQPGDTGPVTAPATAPVATSKPIPSVQSAA